MLNINSILSGIKAFRTGTSIAQDSTSPSAGQTPPVTSEDTFEQGQWWKNRAQPLGENGSMHGMAAYGSVVHGKAVFDAPAPFDEKQGGAPSGRPANQADAPLSVADQEESDEQLLGSTESDTTEVQEEGEGRPAGEPLSAQPTKPNGEPLEPAEQQMLKQLQKADMEVRAHEMAHLAAAGGHAKGGASFTYQQGPDGKRYAVGGEVSIDMSSGATPEETISKMRIVRRAALAPADPSPQDQKVAARATLNITEATQELRLAEQSPETENGLKEAAETYGAKDRESGEPKDPMEIGQEEPFVPSDSPENDENLPGPSAPARGYPTFNPYTNPGERASSLDFMV